MGSCSLAEASTLVLGGQGVASSLRLSDPHQEHRQRSYPGFRSGNLSFQDLRVILRAG